MTPVNATQYAYFPPLPPKKKKKKLVISFRKKLSPLLRMIADRNSDKRTKLRYYSLKREKIY